MANQQHVDILIRDGVRIWNLWRKEEPEIVPDLIRATLVGADLAGVNLVGADLTRANLTEANLHGADLTGANLSAAKLTGANLSAAKLIGANLTIATLTGVDLTRASLREAYLTKANLAGATLSEATITEASLTGAYLAGANLTAANLWGADLNEANFRSANLRSANLSRTSCVETTFTGATLTGCTVYGISAWDVDLREAKQADLCITPEEAEVKITVDNLEVAQFLYLLLSNQRVRAVLDTITSKVVLILGRFSDERKPVLDALREALRSHPNGYIPVVFDFDPQQDKPVFETVKVVANLARFVVADLTDPRMVRSELSYITANVPSVPVQPIVQRDADLPPEFATWELYKSFLPVYRYADLPQLLARLTEAVITPVEGHVRARPLADADGAN